MSATSPVVPLCIPDEAAVGDGVCPAGYRMVLADGVPFSAGAIDLPAASLIMGTAAFFYGLGNLLSIIRRGV